MNSTFGSRLKKFLGDCERTEHLELRFPDTWVDGEQVPGWAFGTYAWIIDEGDGWFDCGDLVGRFQSLDAAKAALFAFVDSENGN